MKTFIIYHGNCYDGFGAAWAAWRRFGDEAVYIPATHDMDPQEIFDQIPIGPNTAVYFVDFSYDRETIARMRTLYGLVYVIDHHKSAEAELKGICDCTFDLTKSGAVLAWMHFHPNDSIPELLLYIQDRDLWRHALMGSKEFSAALRSYPFDFKEWSKIYDRVDELIKEGAHVLRHINTVVDRICDHSYVGRMGNERIPIVNATAYWSEVGQGLLRRYPEFPCVASYYITKDRKKVWSLRSRGGFDCSAIAVKYGGGGHLNAAGFVEVGPF